MLVLPSGERIKTPASLKLRRDTATTLLVEKQGYHSTRVYLDREANLWAFLPFAGNLFHLVPNAVDIVLEPGSDPAPSTTASVFDPSQQLGGASPLPSVGIPEQMKVDASVAIAIHLVPAGQFFSGCNESADTDCFADEKLGQNRWLDAFEIDASEVTTVAFRGCVSDGGCSEPRSGASCNWERSERDWHPINCVDWDQARAYCEWNGKRLPTEWEWEKAARGTDGRKFPWGNEAADCGRAVMENEDGSACGQGPTTFEVGSKPSGRSPFGLLDMAGNVWEWTSSTSREPSLIVVRGGSWFDNATLARVSFRGKYPASSQIPSLGFRCAVSVDASPSASPSHRTESASRSQPEATKE